MFHRVEMDEMQNINPYYYQRGMVHQLDNLIALIKRLKKEEKDFGCFEQALSSHKYFHLSFDDGFKEHFQVAKYLKEKFNPPNKGLSFSINVGNSLLGQYTGMDLLYAIKHFNKMDKLEAYLQMDLKTVSIEEIKKIVASMEPEQLIGLSNHFSELHPYLETIFMKASEVKELSCWFTINSHGITHRFLTHHQEQSKIEILESKKLLEELCGHKIETFCYPEGKNNDPLKEQCKLAGYVNALSIKHETDNDFGIGRKMI